MIRIASDEFKKAAEFFIVTITTFLLSNFVLPYGNFFSLNKKSKDLWFLSAKEMLDLFPYPTVREVCYSRQHRQSNSWFMKDHHKSNHWFTSCISVYRCLKSHVICPPTLGVKYMWGIVAAVQDISFYFCLFLSNANLLIDLLMYRWLRK